MIEFHSSFSGCGRHFVLKDYWEFFKSLHCNEVLSLPEKILAHFGCCCVQRSPGSASYAEKFLHNQTQCNQD